jgi:ComEC/Rec2-related protein
VLTALASTLIASRLLECLAPEWPAHALFFSTLPLCLLFGTPRCVFAWILGWTLAACVPISPTLARDAEPFPVSVVGIVDANPPRQELFGTSVGLVDGPRLSWNTNTRVPAAGSVVRATGVLDGDARRMRLSRPPSADECGRAWAPAVQASLAERLSRHQEQRTAALLCALLLGQGRLDAQFQDLWKRSGTWHLVAISGMHFVMLLALVRGLTGPRPMLLLPLVVGYALLCGLGPPLQRALITSSLVLLAPLVGRRTKAPRNLLLALALVLLFWPECTAHAGFWLTFAATAGILCAEGVRARTSEHRNWTTRLGQHVLNDCRISLAASTTSAPILAQFFGQLTPLSVLTTLILAPVVFLLMAGGLVKMLLPELPLLGTLLDVTVTLVVAILEWIARWPEANLSVHSPTAWVWCGVAGAVACIAARRGWATVLGAALLMHGSLLMSPAPGPRFVLAAQPSAAILHADASAAEVIAASSSPLNAAPRYESSVLRLVPHMQGPRLSAALVQDAPRCARALREGARVVLWWGGNARSEATAMCAAAGVPLECVRRGRLRVIPQPSAP